MPKLRNPQIKFDRLQMYFRKPYTIDIDDAEGTITVYQPTIGDIVDIGEENFYGTLNLFVTNTTTYRLPLWKAGLDWNKISDFELFLLLYQQINPDVSKLLFGDLDWGNFDLFQRNNPDGTNEKIMKDSKTGVEITEGVYLRFSQYLQNVFNIHPEEKLTDDPILKTWYVKKDERAIENAEKKDDEKSNSLLPIISACVNHPGFKYNVEELKSVGAYQFFDSVSRLQIYESTTALMKGMYSGFVDTSKIPDEQFNFMRDI